MSWRTWWYGRGAGQTGDPGVAVRETDTPGVYEVRSQGYSIPLPGGGRGWTEGRWRRVRADSPQAAIDRANEEWYGA